MKDDRNQPSGINQEQFQRACDKVMHEQPKSKGIGTLGEKTLHSVLKNYFEPIEDHHEIKVGNYVADIAGETGIIEIQTRQFNKLRNKLEFFLPQTQVTIVYPVAAVKWLVWIDEETGETTKKRKSPKQGRPCDVFFELYKIKNYLCHPHLKLDIVLLEIEEYRSLNGWSEDKKKGSTRYDRIPTAIVGEATVHGCEEYEKLIPEGLKEPFTSSDFKKASGLSLSVSQTALNVLNYVGAVERVGKQGNRYLYERTQSAGQGIKE